MPCLHLRHRAPGVIGAVYDSKHVMAEIICDGVHIHPAAVRATFEMMGEDRMILISDSMRAAGMPDGSYTLGRAGCKRSRKPRYTGLRRGDSRFCDESYGLHENSG